MNISEANAVFNVLDQLPKAIPYVNRDRRDSLIESAVMLADRARKVLSAGPSGEETRAELEAQTRTW